MTKFTVKTKLSNIKKEDGQFTYKEEIVSMKWDEKAQRDAVQSGKGPGEFGPDYSHRKQYQLGHGNESPSPKLKEFLVNTHRNPRQSPYPSHVIEEYRAPIKRSRPTPLTKEEIELRHAELKRKHNEHLKGRHKSQWIHAHDDGRINNPPHGVGYDPYDLKPVKRKT